MIFLLLFGERRYDLGSVYLVEMPLVPPLGLPQPIPLVFFQGYGCTPYKLQRRDRLVYSYHKELDCLFYSQKAYIAYCDFTSYLHYCSELFWASVISNSITNNEDDRFTAFGNPAELIGLSNLYIPDVIRDYVATLSTNHTTTGDKVYSNLPPAAVPRSYIPAVTAIPATEEQPEVPAVPALDSGSFGIPGEYMHNAYECYPSPYITRLFIQQQIDVSDGKSQPGEWKPFPQLSSNYAANRNLLGYYPGTHLHRETVEKLRTYTFLRCSKNRDSILGRIRHSAELMADVSLELRRKANDRNSPFRITAGISAPKPTMSRLVTNIAGLDADVDTIIRDVIKT